MNFVEAVENAPALSVDAIPIHGSLIFGPDIPNISCEVSSLTNERAKLRIDTDRLLPKRFELSIPNKSHTLPCEVKWRVENVVGVRFLTQL